MSSLALGRPWIKICGLTEPENALACACMGADAIGLIFFKKSPRNVSVHQAAQISNILPEHVRTIGVFVNETFDGIMEKVTQCRLKGVQLHGDEPSGLVDRLAKENLMVIKALFAAKTPFLTRAAEYKTASFFLVEYGKGMLPGGNAESWNYEQSLELKKTHTPVILAGGLHPGNVCKAIGKALPAAVDVSSGVEKTPGIKDLIKVRAFITQVNALQYQK